MKETSQAELDLKGILSSEEPEAVLKVTLDTPLSQNGKIRRDIIPALYDRKKSRLISALHLQKIFIQKR